MITKKIYKKFLSHCRAKKFFIYFFKKFFSQKNFYKKKFFGQRARSARLYKCASRTYKINRYRDLFRRSSTLLVHRDLGPLRALAAPRFFQNRFPPHSPILGATPLKPFSLALGGMGWATPTTPTLVGNQRQLRRDAPRRHGTRAHAPARAQLRATRPR